MSVLVIYLLEVIHISHNDSKILETVSNLCIKLDDFVIIGSLVAYACKRIFISLLADLTDLLITDFDLKLFLGHILYTQI